MAEAPNRRLVSVGCGVGGAHGLSEDQAVHVRRPVVDDTLELETLCGDLLDDDLFRDGVSCRCAGLPVDDGQASARPRRQPKVMCDALLAVLEMSINEADEGGVAAFERKPGRIAGRPHDHGDVVDL